MQRISQRERDEKDIGTFPFLLYRYRFHAGTWLILRRGRPSAEITVNSRWKFQEQAEDRFKHEATKIRQGMLALVDPNGKILQYVSEPMVRTRW